MIWDRAGERCLRRDDGIGLAEILVALMLVGVVLVFAVPVVLTSQGIVRRSDGTEVVRTAAMGAVESLRMVPYDDLAVDEDCVVGAANILCGDRVIDVDGVPVRVVTVVEALTPQMASGEEAQMKRVEVIASLVEGDRSWEIATVVAPGRQTPVDGTTTTAPQRSRATLTVNLTAINGQPASAADWPELRLYKPDMSEYFRPTTTGDVQAFTLTPTGTGFGPFLLSTGAPGHQDDAGFDFDEWQVAGEWSNGSGVWLQYQPVAEIIGEEEAVEANVYLPFVVNIRAFVGPREMRVGEVLVGDTDETDETIRLENGCGSTGSDVPCLDFYGGKVLRPGQFFGAVEDLLGFGPASGDVQAPDAGQRSATLEITKAGVQSTSIWVRTVDSLVSHAWGVGESTVTVCSRFIGTTGCIDTSTVTTDLAGYAQVPVWLEGENVLTGSNSDAGFCESTIVRNGPLTGYGDASPSALRIVLDPIRIVGDCNDPSQRVRGAGSVQRYYSRRNIDHFDVRWRETRSSPHSWLMQDRKLYRVVRPDSSCRTNGCRARDTSHDYQEWLQCSNDGRRDWCWRAAIGTAMPRGFQVGYFTYCTDHSGIMDGVREGDGNEVNKFNWYTWSRTQGWKQFDIASRRACPELNP